jgi:hypothetical protein
VSFYSAEPQTTLMLGGYPKNLVGTPNTRERERVLITFKHRVRALRDNSSPGRLHKFQRSESIYTCPRAPFYRETKGLLHSQNALELKEYS